MQSRAEVHGGPPEVHLRDYWKVVWQGRYTVLAILVVIAGLSILKVVLATPIYQATAIVEIRPEARRILPGEQQWVGAEGRSWIAEEFYFNTQLEVLKSRDLAERVFHRLHLEQHPRFAGIADPIGAFAGLIQVRAKVNTRLVNVSMTGPDSTEVTEWVNTLAETYVQRNVDEAAESFHAIMDEIQRSLEAFRANMGATDTERFRTAADQELYVPESKQDILGQNLARYNREFADVKVEIRSLDAELTSFDRIRKEGGDFMALPRFSKDPALQDLNSQKLVVERELERLTSEKRAGHPEVRAKAADLQKIEQDMDQQIAQLKDEMWEEYRLAKANAANLEEEIKRTEKGAYEIQQATTAYELSKTDAESKRKVYDVVAETMNQFSLNAQLIYMNNNVSVLDRAIEPRRPIRPRRLLTVAFGCLMGLFMGVGAVLFLDYLDNTIRSPEDIEQYLGLGILAVIPKYRESSSNAAREAFQSLRTSILFSSRNREKRILMFSSAGPQEGKSATVEFVARSLASAGDRVVVVDCDLRRPTQHARMDVSREPGVTNYLLDGKEGEYGPFTQKVDGANLSVMTSGPIPPNPAELVGLAKFRRLLTDLKERFDWVIVDSPPVANLADSVVLASLADMMIMVIKHNENDRDLIRRCLKRLRDIHVDVAGAVLNSVDVETTYYSSYSYMHDYYESGTDDKTKKRRRRLRLGAKDDDDSRKVAL